MKISDLAKDINEYCETNNCYFAYGLIKETINLWHNQDNRNMLCDTAKIMYGQITQGKDVGFGFI